MKRYTVTIRENCTGSTVSAIVPDENGEWVRYDEVHDQLARIEQSDDGHGPAWCDGCGAPLQVVRPGKHQCSWCEDREYSQKLLEQAAQLLRQNGEGLATTIENHLKHAKEEDNGS